MSYDHVHRRVMCEWTGKKSMRKRQLPCTVWCAGAAMQKNCRLDALKEPETLPQKPGSP